MGELPVMFFRGVGEQRVGLSLSVGLFVTVDSVGLGCLQSNRQTKGCFEF